MKALSSTASAMRHTFGALFEALIIAAIVGALVFGYAAISGASPLGAGDTLAAKGGNGHSAGGAGGASITVPDGVFGGTTTATANPGDGSWALAACYQNGAQVYGQYVKIDASNQAVFTLGPTPSWSGGAANCIAEEGTFGSNGRWHSIASTTFNVSG